MRPSRKLDVLVTHGFVGKSDAQEENILSYYMCMANLWDIYKYKNIYTYIYIYILYMFGVPLCQETPIWRYEISIT